jgi:hypothetical protein
MPPAVEDERTERRIVHGADDNLDTAGNHLLNEDRGEGVARTLREIGVGALHLGGVVEAKLDASNLRLVEDRRADCLQRHRKAELFGRAHRTSDPRALASLGRAHGQAGGGGPRDPV